MTTLDALAHGAVVGRLFQRPMRVAAPWRCRRNPHSTCLRAALFTNPTFCDGHHIRTAAALPYPPSQGDLDTPRVPPKGDTPGVIWGAPHLTFDSNNNDLPFGAFPKKAPAGLGAKFPMRAWDSSTSRPNLLMRAPNL
jgi:hypothetical protein